MNSLVEEGDPTPIDENKDWLSELVGEGKKFKDTQALAKAKAFSDAHIKIVESRFDTLSEDHRKLLEEARARASLEELLNQMKTEQQQISSREQTPTSNESTQPTMDLNKLDSLISEKLEAKTQADREKTNFEQVESKLKERFGESYKVVVKQKSEQLGLSIAETDKLARSNPKLFYKTFDVNQTQQESFQNLPKGSSFVPKVEEKRGWSFYQNLRKENPQAWMDKKIAIQMEKDAQRMGLKDFYNS